MIEKIVSGGQTGVDRAALDVAIELDIPYGGWCPSGRIDELGIIPEKYRNLKELEGNFNTDKEKYDARTKMNITDSDGTLILVPKIPLPDNIKDGTLLTIEEVKRQEKEYLLIDISNLQTFYTENIKDWIRNKHILTLNIAGPRETSWPGIYKMSFAFLKESLLNLKLSCSSCKL